MHDLGSDFLGPAFLSPKRRKSKLGPTPTIIIGDCASNGELDSLVEDIRTCWERKVGQLTLEFREVNEMSGNAALLTYELLRHKPPGITIISNAMSPILGPGVIVWLAGDRRFIRSTGWLYFRKSRKPRRTSRPPWFDEAEESWRAREPDDSPDFGAVFHDQVGQIIDKYLPINEFANKLIVPSVLAEWGLLDRDQWRSEPISPRKPPATPGENY
jgi:hypothetical protein